MATISRNQQANIVAVLGASGSGKTSYVMQRLKREKPKRLIIWDTKGEFSREGYATPVYTLAEAVKAMQNKAFRVAYIPRGDAATMKRDEGDAKQGVPGGLYPAWRCSNDEA